MRHPILLATAMGALAMSAACGGPSEPTTGETATGASPGSGSTGAGSTGAGTTGAGTTGAGTAGTGTTGAGTAGTGTTGGSTATPAQTWLRELSVSPSGSDSAEGTAAAPFRTIGHAISAAKPGDRITVQAGTYAEAVNIADPVAAGTADQPIRLEGQGTPKIIPEPSSRANLVTIARPNWQVAGFEVDVQGQQQYGVAMIGDVTGSVISGSHIHHGSAGAGVATYYDATGGTIEGNEIDHFIRADDSHGVLVEPTSKHIVIRHNKIHENSGDAVQCIGPEDYYAAGTPPADDITIDSNEMYSDHEQAADIKTCHNVHITNNVMHDYLQTSLPGGCSMVIHMSAENVLVEGNQITNVGKAIAIGGNHYGPVPLNVVVRRNRISHVVLGDQLEGIGIRLENSQSAQVLNNTITGADYAAIAAGGGDQGATTDLTIENNILAANSGGRDLSIGSYAPGLSSDYNLFWGSGTISNPSGTFNLSSWQSATGHDAHSRSGDPQLAPATMMPGAAAVDWGTNVGLPFCGGAPDVGAVETGCATAS